MYLCYFVTEPNMYHIKTVQLHVPMNAMLV